MLSRSGWVVVLERRLARVLILAATGALIAATAAAQATPPATLAQVTMSAEATKRAHLQEINVDTAMKLANACIAYSRAANPNGGATVVVVGPSGNIVFAM